METTVGRHLLPSAFSNFAKRKDGTLWACSHGAEGRLGHGSETIRSSPTQVGALTTWAAISGNANGSLALKTDGTLGLGGIALLASLGTAKPLLTDHPQFKLEQVPIRLRFLEFTGIVWP